MPDDHISDALEERRNFVKAQYDHLWEGVKSKLENVLAHGERDLSRVHLFMRRNFGPGFDDAHLQEKYNDHEKKVSESGFICDRQLIRVIAMDPRIVTLMTDAVKMREAISVFGPDVGRIVELGSGWGKNLFNLFKFGAPLEAEYWGMELTQSGRELMKRVATETVSSMKVGTAPFDYYNADFSLFATPANTCVFTHHSIEQIPEVSVQLIERILSIPGFRCCLHFEPCGFQIPGNNWLADSSQSGLMTEIDEANKRFAVKRNQNTNLYNLLRELEQAGRITIHTVRKYFTSHLINNATTMIVWAPNHDSGKFPVSGGIRDDLNTVATQS